MTPIRPSRLLAPLLALAALTARADLQSDIAHVLKEKTLARAEVGIEVVHLGPDLASDKVLFKHNSEIPLIPASNLKLVTTSAALNQLGPDFKFRTLLLKHNNDLVIIGDGDPTLGDAELAKKTGLDVTTLFKTWADGLKKAGLQEFARLVLDDSVFDGQFAHPNWPADQMHKRYVAEVAGLNLNANCVDFYLRTTAPGETVKFQTSPPTAYISVSNNCVTGGENAVWLSRQPGSNAVILKGRTPASNVEPISVTVHDPALFAGTVLRETLTSAGIKVAPPVRDRTLRAALLKTPIDQDPSWTVLAVHETPLRTVLARANKDSMNLYAESLCKRLGAAASPDNQPGSWKNGTAAVGAFLQKIGVATTEFRLDDGCGLSKENAISANALCTILRHNYHDKTVCESFCASLSVAGQDGTLENRFAGTDLRGRVFAKSGFVNNVRTLSGLVRTRDDQWYAFSILFNQLADTATGRNLQEQIVHAIDVRSKELAATE